MRLRRQLLRNSSDGSSPLCVPVYRFVLFEQLGGGSWCTPRVLHLFSSQAGTLLDATARREVAMPRRWKALIFLTALLAATLSYASFASAKTDNITV
jgi:hypothetical protein